MKRTIKGICPKCNSKNINCTYYDCSRIDKEIYRYEYDCVDCKFKSTNWHELKYLEKGVATK
jgi:hypothetical protein